MAGRRWIVAMVLALAWQAPTGARAAGVEEPYANPLPADLKGTEPTLLDDRPGDPAAPGGPGPEAWYYVSRPTELLDSPSILAGTIARLGVGDRVSFTEGGTEGGFMFVRTPAGLEGWAARGNLVLLR